MMVHQMLGREVVRNLRHAPLLQESQLEQTVAMVYKLAWTCLVLLGTAAAILYPLVHLPLRLETVLTLVRQVNFLHAKTIPRRFSI